MTKKNKEAEIPFEHGAPAVQTASSVVVAADDYSAYAGMGFENMDRSDFAVPFLGVIQPVSPIINTNAEARPGMLINTVSSKLYDGKKGVVIIPVSSKHTMIEWKDRDAGGGYVGEYELGDPFIEKVKNEQEFGKYKKVKGEPLSNDLIDTYTLYCILVNE